ncbi:AAC(3) family N-acetyltransferase [Natronomonas amylolytica]|uniref:AAC(3) family N-acetyltransferase n=1 Tax=Natronomonas amylolytica TaxID=3108498 RepID=UPI00300A36E2
MNLKKHFTRWPVFGIHKLLEERPRRVGSVAQNEFNQVFESYEDDVVFVHAGLSDVNKALPGDPYEQILTTLDRNFDSILAPGFTDYFKMSRVYSKQYSRPKHGTFNFLFLDDSDYRTDDACRSILVKGEYRFEGRNHHDTFASDSCFAQLGEDDVLLTSIGTPWLMCSFLHYLEWKYRVPYVTKQSFEGVLFDGKERREIEQETPYWDGFWRFNKLKLHRHWRKHGIVDEYNLNGLRLFFTSLADIEEFVGHRLQSDPYYLVT